MMDWFNTLFNAASAATNGRFDKNAPERIGSQLSSWVGHFVNNASLHWSKALIDNQVCDFCRQDALSECISCGARVCLQHAHVSYRAEAVCDECVESLLESRQEERKARRQYNRRQEKAQAPKTEVSPEVKEAFKKLGLKFGAPWDEVRIAYKGLSLKYHPDTNKRASAQSKMVEINQAYSVLKNYYEV
jgi:hypothetical protein